MRKTLLLLGGVIGGFALILVVMLAAAAGVGDTSSQDELCGGLAGGNPGGGGTVVTPMQEGAYRVSSGYGMRNGVPHRGVDFAAPVDTEIYAAAAGRVVRSGPASGFGNWIVIDHQLENQTVSTVYGHMFTGGLLVEVGDDVAAGDLIAKVGNAGQSTGPHLHFEVWPGGRTGGSSVDPQIWLSENLGTAPPEDPGPPVLGADLLPVPPIAAQSRLPVDAEVTANVETIVGVALGVGLSLRAAVIGVATAAQESILHNIDGGDRDSIGLFQQRPSTGWGTPEEIGDPVLAAQAFYGVAEHTSNPGLIDIGGWSDMPLTVAAQAVQRSGFPDAYAQWEVQAAELVDAARNTEPINGPGDAGGGGAACSAALTGPGAGADGPTIPDGLEVRTDWPAEEATVDDPTSNGQITPRLAALLARLTTAGYLAGGASCWDPHPQNPASDHPRGMACDVFFDPADPAAVARGWELANALIADQSSSAASNLIWQGQSWVASNPEQWTTYRSQTYGCPDPTNLTGCHYDHIHLSVY